MPRLLRALVVDAEQPAPEEHHAVTAATRSSWQTPCNSRSPGFAVKPDPG